MVFFKNVDKLALLVLLAMLALPALRSFGFAVIWAMGSVVRNMNSDSTGNPLIFYTISCRVGFMIVNLH